MNNRGFTLIEVVTGIVILALGLLAITGMQISSVKGNYFSSSMTQASVLAQDRLEALRNLDSSDGDLGVGLHDEGEIAGTLFTRQYTVASVPGVDMLNVTVTVRWNNGADHSVSFSTVRAL